MTLRDALIREFDLELPYTRRSLERVPIDKFGGSRMRNPAPRDRGSCDL